MKINIKDLLEDTPIYSPQKRVLGYKVLLFLPRYSPWLYSPSYRVDWENGELEADAPPDKESSDYADTTYHGIHFTKTYNNRILLGYVVSGVLRETYVYLVECELSGEIVETEEGYRSQYAKITRGIFIDHAKYRMGYSSFGHSMMDYDFLEYKISKELQNGNWKDYQEIYYTTQEAYRREGISPWEAQYQGEWRDRE